MARLSPFSAPAQYSIIGELPIQLAQVRPCAAVKQLSGGVTAKDFSTRRCAVFEL
jgi:hypothetical protein